MRWQTIRNWLIPHPLPEEKQRVATLLTFIMLAFAVGVPVYAVVILIDDPQLALPRTITLGIFVVFLGAMVALMRQGRVHLVGWLMVLQMWLGLSFFVFIDSGINSPAFHWYTVIIIVAGLIMGRRGLVLTTAASVGISIVVVILNRMGFFGLSAYDPVYIWALDAAAFVFTAFFLALAVNGLRQSLDRAHQAEANWRALVEENPDRIYRISRADLESTNNADPHLADILDRLPTSDHNRFFRTMRKVFDEQRTLSFDYELDEVSYSLRVNPIFYSGQVTAVIVTLRDITESRRAEEQRLQLAVETEKLGLLQALVADVTHDMKAPLTSIETGLYLLKRTNPDIDTVRIEGIRAQTWALNDMVQNLLTIMRLDSSPDLEMVSVDLQVLCDGVMALFNETAQRKGIRLQIAVDPDARTVQADPGELKRVLDNLVENAINYTPEGGAVTVRVQRRAGLVMIEVADTGMGISETDQARVFERFFRSDNARTRMTRGSGLGLAIAKRIVDLHGGQIEFESEVAQGTCFRVLLPAPQ